MRRGLSTQGGSIPQPLNIFLTKGDNFRFLPYNMAPKEEGDYSKRFSNERLDCQTKWCFFSYTVELRLTTIPLIQAPHYYSHFILARKKLSQSFSYLKNPFNTTTPSIRPVFHGPKVVVLTGFHCILHIH